MATCKACKHEHPPMQHCSVARRLREGAACSPARALAEKEDAAMMALAAAAKPHCLSTLHPVLRPIAEQVAAKMNKQIDAEIVASILANVPAKAATKPKPASPKPNAAVTHKPGRDAQPAVTHNAKSPAQRQAARRAKLGDAYKAANTERMRAKRAAKTPKEKAK